jgi:hypothetical protein
MFNKDLVFSPAGYATTPAGKNLTSPYGEPQIIRRSKLPDSYLTHNAEKVAMSDKAAWPGQIATGPEIMVYQAGAG